MMRTSENLDHHELADQLHAKQQETAALNAQAEKLKLDAALARVRTHHANTGDTTHRQNLIRAQLDMPPLHQVRVTKMRQEWAPTAPRVPFQRTEGEQKMEDSVARVRAWHASQRAQEHKLRNDRIALSQQVVEITNREFERRVANLKHEHEQLCKAHQEAVQVHLDFERRGYASIEMKRSIEVANMERAVESARREYIRAIARKEGRLEQLETNVVHHRKRQVNAEHRDNLLNYYTAKEMYQASEQELAGIWSYYDVDKVDSMSEEVLAAFTGHLVERVLGLYAQNLFAISSTVLPPRPEDFRDHGKTLQDGGGDGDSREQAFLRALEAHQELTMEEKTQLRDEEVMRLVDENKLAVLGNIPDMQSATSAMQAQLFEYCDLDSTGVLHRKDFMTGWVFFIGAVRHNILVMCGNVSAKDYFISKANQIKHMKRVEDAKAERAKRNAVDQSIQQKRSDGGKCVVM